MLKATALDLDRTNCGAVEDWIPKVLSAYEIGRSISAIEMVNVAGKPIAEVGCRAADLELLKEDLRGCLRLSNTQTVRLWTRPSGRSFRFGFYRDDWALEAIDFLDRAKLSELERAWISGLVFGYRSDAIQDFINRTISGTMKETS